MEGDEVAQVEGAPAPASPAVQVWTRTLRETLLGLKDSTVSHVELSGKNIGDVEVVAIGAVLKDTSSLEQLYLYNNRIGDDAAVVIGAALAQNTSLRQLDLANNQIGSRGAAAIGTGLSHNTSLQQLYLHNNWIGDRGAVAIGAALEHNTSLQHLYLSNNQIGDSGAVAISAALARNTALQQLYLSNNQIGDSGAVAISAALAHNTSLQQLYLWGCTNRITDTGAAVLFSGLKNNNTLTYLDLEHCPIRTIGTEFLWTWRLKKCALSFNGLVWPPPSLTRQGRIATYRYLHGVKEKSAPLTRSRVMFVGAAGSGKTTLKTALLLRGAGARDTLRELQRSIIETIEVQWTEADLQEWVDTDVAHKAGFFSSCPRTEGLTGKRWLRMSPCDVSRVFGDADTFTSKAVVAQMTAVLQFLTSNSDDVAMHDVMPYKVLLNIPHVWTEGVELNLRWEEYTLWDFPGQMELYPSHRLFLACETAVYVLVVNGRTGKVAGCMRQLHRWLSLIRSGMRNGGSRVEARIVVTHTDTLTTAHRKALLRDVQDKLVTGYADHFNFGERCYATTYEKASGGDVDAVRAELTQLRSALPPNRPLPASYQAICDDVLTLARENARWPVVPISAIDWRGEDEALVCLEDLGFVRRANDQVILEPVTWLSTLMSAFLHPLHGIKSRSPPPLSEGATAASLRKHHVASVLVDTEMACQIVNLRSKVVDPEHESEVLPLLAHFDICFSPLDDGKYVFPLLLPHVNSLPSWLARPFEGAMVGRRYVCSGAHEVHHDYIPPTVAALLMERVVTMGRRLGGTPMFFGRGTVVMGFGGTSLITVHLSDDDRSLDLFANATEILSFAALHLMALLASKYRGIRLTKHRITRLPHDQVANPFVQNVCNHPLLGPCRVDSVTTVVRDSYGAITPEWLRDAYETTLPKVSVWYQGEFNSRAQYFVSKWEHTVGDRAHLLVDDHLVEETHVPIDIPSPSDGPLVVVASCPHTMSLTNTPPFCPVDNVNVFDVFAHCEALQRAGRIRIAYDRKGTTTASARDIDVIWSLSDPRLDGKTDDEKWEAVKLSVSGSAWFEDSFQTQIKTMIKAIAQSEPGRELWLVCIRGGPVTEIEQEYMSKIVSDSHKDATTFGLPNLRIIIDIQTFSDFRQEFPLQT